MRIPFFNTLDSRQVEKRLLALEGKSLASSWNEGGWVELMGAAVRKLTLGWKGHAEIFEPLSPDELELAFSCHPIVQACVRVIMQTFAKVRFEVGAWKDEQTWEPLKSAHWALDLLEAPNPEYSRNDFMQCFASRFMLTGRTYSIKFRTGGGRGRPGQLWPVPTSWITPVFGRGVVALQGYKVRETRDLVQPEDMVAARLVDPGTMLGGVSPLNAAFRDLRLDQERENYLGEMLHNMKLPSMVVRPKEKALTPAQQQEARTTLDERVGRGKRGNALVLPVGAEVDIVNPLADLDWPGLSNLLETRICAAFGTPPIVVGLRSGLENGTYSNYEQAMIALINNTMIPFWDVASACFTLHLLRREGEHRLEFRARYDELPECQEDANDKAKRAGELFKADVVSRDEAREDLGLPPDPNWKPRPVAPPAIPGKPSGQPQDDPNADPAKE